MTRTAPLILQALAARDGFTSAQDLYGELRGAGSRIGLSTIYRSLATLAARGDLDTITTETGETLHRHCGSSEHHHHLICRHCGHTTEVSAPRVEWWAQNVARQYGYTDASHRIEVYGVCATCAASDSPPR